MKLKLACSDFTFPILPHDQALQLISMLGIKGVDIGLLEDQSHLQPSSEFVNSLLVDRQVKRLEKPPWSKIAHYPQQRRKPKQVRGKQGRTGKKRKRLQLRISDNVLDRHTPVQQHSHPLKSAPPNSTRQPG